MIDFLFQYFWLSGNIGEGLKEYFEKPVCVSLCGLRGGYYLSDYVLKTL